MRALPFMPQLEVLVYGCISHRLTPSLLDSVACQPRLVSLQLIGKWPEGVVCRSVLRLEDMTRLTRLRLDVAELRSIQRMPVLEHCTVAVTLLNPDPSCNAQGARYTAWALHAFTSLSSLSIEWDDRHRPGDSLSEMLAAVPKSVRSLDITCTHGCKLNLSWVSSRKLVALRLRINGLLNSPTTCLRATLRAKLQRLTIQAWGVHVRLGGAERTFLSMTDMHVEAASIDANPLGRPPLRVQERLQVSTRLPDESEIYGGTGGQPVQVTHLGQWPPSVPGYEGPDVPGAPACCYWPCTCGACESCRRADFWRVPLGSG